MYHLYSRVKVGGDGGEWGEGEEAGVASEDEGTHRMWGYQVFELVHGVGEEMGRKRGRRKNKGDSLNADWSGRRVRRGEKGWKRVLENWHRWAPMAKGDVGW
jgi:hypothetical protein